MEKSLSQQVAAIGANLKFEDLPERVVNNSKMFILDLLGNIIASRHIESSEIVLETAKDLGGTPTSTAVGCNYKTSAQMAALINGTFGHAFDMDDDHRYGIQHPSVVVFPAVLALAERFKKSGKDVITAFAYGSEITIRLGESFEGQTYYQGFHPTGTCGVFGATGGAAKLLGLDEEKITYALGLAGSQAAGLLEWKAQGTWSKRYQAGHPAMCGVISALMAKNGYTAPTTVWDGQDGFIRAYSYKDIYNYEKVSGEFGKRWEMADTSIKVHACCRFSAPLADAGVELYKRGIDYKNVESVLARVNKYSIKVLTIPTETKADPKTVVDAQFSLPYAIACGMVKGHENIDDYTNESIRDPEVLGLAKKVTWMLDPEIEKVYPKYYPCTVEVTMKDGSKEITHIEYPKGDPENPVCWDEAVEKFRFMAGHEMGSYKVEKIIDLCSRLETLDNLDELADMLY
ncbi:MmgE/PrpD family protein [Marasmitruncus massiliensis]|uniref:MmgE/PrpD family protein n=1 Tax=Marasmitruncus massiliensis TaxID=1944642 RepID=UPI000C7A53CB|nr:MmgE/PrpD family protein [Marasmitruncus massiliensis]